MSPYIVAGATGRVGSVVAKELLAQGDEVTVIVRDPARGASWKERGAQVAVGSLGDSAFLANALQGASGFFALLPEDLSVPDFRATRRRIAEVIAEAVQQSEVPHVVFLSAVTAYLAEGNGPAKDLHYAERLLRATTGTLTILRACWLQENLAGMIAPARHAGIYPNLLPSADVAIPTIATRDIGRTTASLLRNPPQQSEIIDLHGPVYSVRQLADALGAALGTRLQIVDVPAAGHVEALTQAGLPRSFAEDVAEVYACFASGRVRPRGDRSVAGSTTIDETLTQLLAASSGSGVHSNS